METERPTTPKRGSSFLSPATEEKKSAAVSAWLKTIFSEVPPFEVNDATLDRLFELSRVSTRRNVQTDKMTEDMKEFADVYEREADRLLSRLDAFGVKKSDLSASGLAHLHSIARTASLLKLKDTETCSFLCALSDLSRERFDVETAIDAEQHILADLLQQQRDAISTLHTLKRIEEELETESKEGTSRMATQRKNIAYLEEKVKQYTATMRQLKQSIDAAGATPDIYHSTLVHLGSQVTHKQNELDTIRRHLAAYSKLPPDVGLARMELDRAKRELADVEAKFAQTIGDMVH